MGYYLIEHGAAPAPENRPAAVSDCMGSKTPIGAPFGKAILSSKYWDQDTKLAYYGYRYDRPSLGRWLSRDPVGEKIELRQRRSSMRPKYDLSNVEPNLYLFVANDSPNITDKDGRLPFVPYGNWCGPGRCGGENSPNCEGNDDWWDDARWVEPIDDLDRCCMAHDACLAHRVWVPIAEGPHAPGVWLRNLNPPDDCGCDRSLCACSFKASSGGKTRVAIFCLFCGLFAPHCL